MDYDETLQEYRMIDNFSPEEISLNAASSRSFNKSGKKNSKQVYDPATVKTGNWSPHIGIQKVAWNNTGIGRAGWLASGTASGVGRVDIVKGRWMKGKVPADLDYSDEEEGKEVRDEEEEGEQEENDP
jgi:transcription factor C subunit 6